MKTAEEYKKEFLKRASIGYLLKIFRSGCNYYTYDYITNTYKERDITVEDVIWSRECGIKKFHTWTEKEFRSILASKPNRYCKNDGKSKRQLLAKKYRHSRSHKKKQKIQNYEIISKNRIF